MVRGGSSPLGRIEKACLAGLFLCFEPDLARSIRVHRISHEKLCTVLCTPRGPRDERAADRERWVVRWRDGSGRQRGRRFESEPSARAFDAGLREVAPANAARTALSGPGASTPTPPSTGRAGTSRSAACGTWRGGRARSNRRTVDQPGERTSELMDAGDWKQGRRGCQRRFDVVACVRAAHLAKVHRVYLLDILAQGA
jgi:hypothetical protein